MLHARRNFTYSSNANEIDAAMSCDDATTVLVVGGEPDSAPHHARRKKKKDDPNRLGAGTEAAVRQLQRQVAELQMTLQRDSLRSK